MTPLGKTGEKHINRLALTSKETYRLVDLGRRQTCACHEVRHTRQGAQRLPMSIRLRDYVNNQPEDDVDFFCVKFSAKNRFHAVK